MTTWRESDAIGCRRRKTTTVFVDSQLDVESFIVPPLATSDELSNDWGSVFSSLRRNCAHWWFCDTVFIVLASHLKKLEAATATADTYRDYIFTNNETHHLFFDPRQMWTVQCEYAGQSVSFVLFRCITCSPSWSNNRNIFDSFLHLEGESFPTEAPIKHLQRWRRIL